MSISLGMLFISFCLQITFWPFLGMKERANIIREEAEETIFFEVQRLERASRIADIDGKMYYDIIHRQRMQMDVQTEFINKHVFSLFNYNVIESIFCIQKAKENRHGALKMSKIIMSQQVKEPYFKKLGLLIVEAKNERKRKELKKAKLYASMAIGGVLIGVSSFFTGGVIIGLIALSGIIITAGIRTKIAWNERKNNKSLVRQVRNIDELNKIIALFYSCKSKNEFSDLKSKFPNISIKLEEILKNLSYLEKSNKSILSFFEFTQDSFASKRNLLTFRLNELERHMKLFESLSKKRQIELNISLIELTNDIGVEMKSMLGIFRDEQSGLSFQDPAKKGYLLNSKVLLDILIDSKNGNSMFSEKLGSESELFASIVLNRNFEKYDKKSPFKDYDYLLKKLKKAMKV